jgi:cellulose synthase (UDP-forming)
VTIVIIHRRYFVSEGELISSAEKTWGMIGFAFIAFVMSLFGLIAAWSSRRLKDEDPWDKVNLNDIKI